MLPDADRLPHDGGARCEACAYALAGLPMKGRCPECGVRYAFAFLYHRRVLGSERCGSARCGYHLRGLPLRGTCPECGQEYRYDRPVRVRPRPGFWRGCGIAAERLAALAGLRGLSGRAGGIAVFLLLIAAAVGYVVYELWGRIDAVFIQPNIMH